MIGTESPILNINKAQQICFIVRDLDQSMERLWTLFGIGPWKVNLRDDNATNDFHKITDVVHMNKPDRLSYRIASATLATGLIIELIHPLSGESTYRDFLKQHGEGMHHIGWHFVNSREEFAKVSETLEKNGFPCRQRFETFVSLVGYFDTTEALGAMLEVCYDDPAIQKPAPLAIYPPTTESQGERKMTLPNLPLFEINKAQQVAFVVHDVDKTIERLWNVFGIGPWSIDIRDYNSTKDNELIKDMVYHHKPGRYSYKMAETTLGPNGFIVEYIQPLAGENIYSDFLREHGEGMHHIGWHIVTSQEEFHKVTEQLEGQGFPCLQSARVFASQMAYFDTTSVLNTLLEVSYRDPTKTRPAPHGMYPKL